MSLMAPVQSRQESLGFLIADVSRLLRRAFERKLESGALTLTLAQARTLVYVSRHEGVRQVELAELLEVQPITLARLLDQLAAGGLIERRADPTDRRAFLIYLTPAAQEQLDAIEAVASEIRARALVGIDQAQATAVLAALQTMRANLASR